MKIRCFDVVYGGSDSPHAICIRVERVADVEQMVKRGIDWLKNNGAKRAPEREFFTVDTMGEIVETDPDSGLPLKEQP